MATVRKEIAGKRLVFLGSHYEAPPKLKFPEVAFVGRSNVGKSSAINKLLNTNRAARVSKTPGRTQAINLFEIEERLIFADLPGYGFAKVPDSVKQKWHALIGGYLSDRSSLKLVVVLVDLRRDPQELDSEMIWWLREERVPLMVLATKQDKLSRNKAASALAKVRKGFGVSKKMCIGFSSMSGAGVDEMWSLIDEAVTVGFDA
jgi:GTP-binding protein